LEEVIGFPFCAAKISRVSCCDGILGASIPFEGGNASFNVSPVSFERGIESDPIWVSALAFSLHLWLWHTECLCQLGACNTGSDVERSRIVKGLKASDTVAEKGLMISVNMRRIIVGLSAYLLDSFFETQMRVALDLIHIFRVHQDERLG
jgi:hypothetical protein